MIVKIFSDGYAEFDPVKGLEDRTMDDRDWSEVADHVVEDVCDDQDDVEDEFEILEHRLTSHDDFAERENELWDGSNE